MKKISTTVSTASEVDEIFIVSDEVAERFSNMIDEIEENEYGVDDSGEEMLEAYLFLTENAISSKVEGARTLGDGALYFNDIDISPL